MRKIAIVTLMMLAMAGTALAQGILINELDSDTVGTDMLEFVELYGPGGASLDGYVLVFYNGNGDAVYAAYDLDGYSLDANGFFLLGNTDVVPTPSIIFGSNGLQNGADAAALYLGNDTDFPAAQVLGQETGVQLVDAIVYDTADSDDAELLAGLTPGEPQINEDGGVDKDTDSNQRCPDGGGGALVTSSYYQFPPTPGASNNPACASVPNETGSWGQMKALFD